MEHAQEHAHSKSKYEKLRDMRVARNNQRLLDLGLLMSDDSKPKAKPKRKHVPSKGKSSPVTKRISARNLKKTEVKIDNSIIYCV